MTLNVLTRSNGKKNAEALDDLLPAFKATALPCQSITGEPLEPPLVPEAAYGKEQKAQNITPSFDKLTKPKVRKRERERVQAKRFQDTNQISYTSLSTNQKSQSLNDIIKSITDKFYMETLSHG